MEILLLIRIRHLSSEGPGYLSTFQYHFGRLENQRHRGMVSVHDNNLDKERRKMGRI